MGGKDDETNDDMVAEDAYYFLQSFFNSELGKKYKDLPVYLTGEVRRDVLCLDYIVHNCTHFTHFSIHLYSHMQGITSQQ